MKKTLQTITAGLTALAVLAIFQTVPTHAASFAVATGNDENTDNSSCSLSEAIENINDQAATNTDCAAGDGVNDTITIPAGTITLVADLPTLSESATITGAGMGQTIIDGDSGQYTAINVANTVDIGSFAASKLTIVGYKNVGLALQQILDLSLSEIEIDGTGALPNDPGFGGSLGGIFLGYSDNGDYVANVDNIYVHDIVGDAGAISVIAGIFVATGNDSKVEANVSNSTISNIRSTGSDANDTAIGISYVNYIYGNTATNTTGTVDNVTINNLASDNNSVGGVSVVAIAQDSEVTYDIDVRNSTISNFTGGLYALAVNTTAGAVNPADVADAKITMKNNIFSGSNVENCDQSSDPLGGAGTGTASQTLTSYGGNLSSDTTCSPYFNQAKDQNNLTNLGSTLGPLQNNGGIVPTRALLQGSPAIDSGITIPGLTQDARGSVRPQGSAYDSGAYESPFTTAQSSNPVIQTAQKLADTGESRRIFILFAILVVLTSLSVMIAMQRQKKIHKQ